FDDDADPTLRFSCGVVMEATEGDTNVPRHHFVLPGVRAEEVPALEGRMVRTAKELRAHVRAHFPSAKIFAEPLVYRDEPRNRLGPLPGSFHRLLVKGLDFKPIGQVRQFVLDYLLDERSVDTASLQANIENYKQLEEKAKEAELRLSALTTIC